MKKRVGLCFILVFIAVIAAIFFPLDIISILKDRLLGVGNNYSSLKIYSLGGDIKVYIDGEEKGIAKEKGSYLEVLPIDVGEHEVKLVREATEEGFYPDFERIINCEKGFDTVISWEIGPTEEASSGWILYAQNASYKNGHTLINLTCKPRDCKINIDEKGEHTAPITKLNLSLNEQHTFKASKEGYQDLEVQVLPEDEEARASLEGYELFFEVNLYRIPI